MLLVILEMNKKNIRKILGGFKSYIPGGVSIHVTGGTIQPDIVIPFGLGIYQFFIKMDLQKYLILLQN